MCNMVAILYILFNLGTRIFFAGFGNWKKRRPDAFTLLKQLQTI